MYEGVVQDLIDELGRLPGVGPKSAQRIAFHLLQADPVDVALVHEPGMAAPLMGSVPLLLDGHVHERRSRVADGTLEPARFAYASPIAADAPLWARCTRFSAGAIRPASAALCQTWRSEEAGTPIAA